VTAFTTQLERFGSVPALISSDGDSISYRELAERCDIFARQFSRTGLLLIEMDNDVARVVAYLAALRHKIPTMLIDADLNPQLKTRLVNLYRPEMIFAGEQMHQTATAAEPVSPMLALLLSTSGSTGAPKAVRLSAANLDSNARAIADYLGLDAGETAITLLPLHYSFGLSILNSHLTIGARIVIQRHTIFDKAFWLLMRKQGVTSLSGVPFMYDMLRKLRLGTMDLPDLRTLTQAGGKLLPQLATEFASLCHKKHWRFFVMYGQTEATARISYLGPDRVLDKPASIGRAIPGGSLSLRNELGQEILAPDIPGELIYRGTNVMLGYAEQRPDLLRGDELQGVLPTGDIACVDADGDYFIVGRKKSFIKIFGQRFSLDEVEHHLRQMGLSCACSGRDDLLQIAVNGKATPDEIRKIISRDYRINLKAIDIRIVTTIPTTSSGKIDYHRLNREIFHD
jgi:acyl-CoA synthetase (AMP-forming)/AMP-acid ligase II